MEQQTVLESIMNTYADSIVEVNEPNDRRAYVTCAPKDVPDVCRFMHHRHGGRLAIITGIDTRAGVELLYHFMYPAEHRMITLRTVVKRPFPSIDSVGSFYHAAVWAEREIQDLLGVEFIGLPDRRRLVLSDDWPEAVHPLRRDFSSLDDEARRFTGMKGDGA